MSPESENGYYTLITGASHGIGRSMAFEIAQRGKNLALVALPGKELDDVTGELISKYPVMVKSFGIDLTTENAATTVKNWADGNGIRVEWLINNAGFGAGGLFWNLDATRYVPMIRLNTVAAVMLTHAFLDQVRAAPNGKLLYMSSMEATLPLPYKAVYTGTKNFIWAFALAMREELRPEGKTVTVVCPGPVSSNASSQHRIQSHGNRAKWITLSPDKCAKIAIRGLERSKLVVTPGFIPWAIMKIMKLMPTAVKMRILERIFRVYRYH